MGQSLSKIYIHITFSTKHRYPFIDNDIKDRLFDYLGGICKELECHPVQIGEHQDHVHILCLLSKKVALVQLIEAIKKGSSKWIKGIDTKYSKFYWQEGYGAFSVSPKQTDKVTTYIMNQEEHHKRQAFQDELRTFLNQYKIEYDERYVWD